MESAEAPAAVPAGPAEPQSPDIVADLKAIFQKVSDIRELEPLQEVVPKFISRERFRDLAIKQVDKELVEKDGRF